MGSEAQLQPDKIGGREVIERLIPHRPPFLFVDRILEASEERIVVELDVTRDEPALAGHYPGFPILPGVLTAEFCFQGAALLLSDPERALTSDDPLPVLTRIEDARFKKIIQPGATLRAEIELVEKLGPALYMKAKVSSDGDTVLRIRFVLAAAKPPVNPAASPAGPEQDETDR